MRCHYQGTPLNEKVKEKWYSGAIVGHQLKWKRNKNLVPLLDINWNKEELDELNWIVRDELDCMIEDWRWKTIVWLRIEDENKFDELILMNRDELICVIKNWRSCQSLSYDQWIWYEKMKIWCENLMWEDEMRWLDESCCLSGDWYYFWWDGECKFEI